MNNTIETCSICDYDFNSESEGGICGSIGVLPVQFCPTCLSGVIDMVECVKGLQS